MASIENLGAAYSKRIAQQAAANEPLPRPKRAEGDEAAKTSPGFSRADIRRMEEALKSRESSEERGRANETKVEPTPRMTLEELAEALRKVNLTFDLFEIQARFIIDQKTGEISVQVINQRTGEVIRKIPPYDVPQIVESLKNGEPAVFDLLV